MKNHFLIFLLVIASVWQVNSKRNEMHHKNVKVHSITETGVLGEKDKRACDINLRVANCSSKHLTEVPQDLSTDIVGLDLSDNIISSLGDSLAKYTFLQHLNISRNRLRMLGKDDFAQLNKLEELNLEGNHLMKNNNSLHKSVFRPLISLKVLRLNHNCNDSDRLNREYPDSALSVLTSLVHLDLDMLFNKSFGPGFADMTSLKSLTLSGTTFDNCQPNYLTNDTFQNVAQIEFLSLQKSCINGRLLESGVFNNLTRLKVLDLTGNEQACLDDLVNVLAGLHKSEIYELRLGRILSPYSPCVEVSKRFVEILPQNLTKLIAFSNSISRLEAGVLESLPENLSYLDIGDNRLTYGGYLQYLPQMKQLRTLMINGGMVSYSLPRRFRKEHDCSINRDRSSVLEGQEETHNISDIQLPPNLREISFQRAGLFYKLSNFSVDPRNNLRSLNLNGNNLPELIGPITGMDLLEELDLSESNINHIDYKFFNSFSSLVKLNLSRNYFGENCLSKGKRPLFKALKNLTHLDLSFVNVLTFSDDVFVGLVSLQYLWLNNNAFYYFTMDLSHMIHLLYIDFRFTELATLSRTTIEQLNNISSLTNHSLCINFADTPIHCYCANLFFIQWMATHFPKNLTQYKCVFLDTTERYMSGFDEIYNLLRKECRSEFALFAIILSCTVFLLFVVLASLIYRFRWKLRYLYYSAYLNFRPGPETQGLLSENREYTYDVFISYSSQDHNFVVDQLVPQLQSRGLKVHVHGLHFVAGQYIASNIVSAVQSSRRTLVVLTKNQIKSKWCKFELQMANMEQVHTGRTVLLFLLMEDLSRKYLTTELLYSIQNNTYIRYPENPDPGREMEIFWQKLSQDLLA